MPSTAGREANWQNRTLFHGDNLAFMRAMNSETVDLIATDPPFNKGRDFHATPDSLAAGARFQDRWSWERDVHEEWLDQIQDDYPHVMNVIQGSRSSYGDDMGAFLCFMAVRLIAMRRLLKPTGSIYLHCDPTASHYLKELMDAVFGKRNFRNEIVWCYRGGGVPRTGFARKHDLIFRYSKGKDVTFNVDDVRIPYSESVMESSASRYDKSYRSNKVYSGYRPNEKGKHPEDWWPIQPLMPSDRTERIGWPTQKPLTLYARIVAASSNEGDVVLDPFAGCATTLVAAEKLGRQWVGIDIWQQAAQVVRRRLENEVSLFGAAEADSSVTFTDTPPERTDDGDTAAPFLRIKERVAEPDGPRWSRKQMYEHLLAQHGPRCMGCNRTFDDPRYLELDHNTPRADGGINHVSNRILLCGPCNRLKSNTYTLSGLRRINKQRGYMV
ncbi:MAG: hypothetical protein F4Z29_06680 [Gemmatimonadetes bacterium]|nr:hypothetical protein [Gemmatimonadota bacterium]